MSSKRTFRRSLRANAPRFVKPLSLRVEDDVKVLECHVDGYPRPEIRWEKNGKPVGKSRKIHMIRSGEMCLLQIRMLQADDSGLYSCIATNNLGTASTHFKLITTTFELSVKKVKDTEPQTLSPNRIVGLRSRSMDRSRESIQDSKSECSRSCRSRSASRSSRQDITNDPKSRLSSFTNSIWKKQDLQNSQKLKIVTPNKKEFSKSMEDCRKPRKNFLNKVKIPEIFVAQKQNPVISNGVINQTETFPSVVDKSIKFDKISKVIKTNGNFVQDPVRSGSLKNGSMSNKTKNKPLESESLKNGSVKNESLKNGLVKNESQKNRLLKNDSPKNRLMKNDQYDTNILLKNRTLPNNHVSKSEGNKQNKPKGKIASYLKLFENVDSSSRLKQRENERGGSLKIANDKNKEISNSDQMESDRFFNLGRFLRRKSSGDNKKNTEGSTFISHVSRDLKNSTDMLTDSGSENHAIVSTNNDSSNIFKEESATNNCSEIVNTLKEQEKDITVLPDITGFTLITDSPKDEQLINKPDAKAVSVNAQENLEKLIEENVIEVKIVENVGNQQVDLSQESKQPEKIISEKIISSEDVTKIPSIFVHEIPESEDKEIIEISEILKEEETREDDERTVGNDESSTGRQYEGKISYWSPLVVEKCEDFLETTTFKESLESDLQRVSSPVESPARIVKGPQSVTVLRGESVTLAICFTGEPTPNVTWMKGCILALAAAWPPVHSEEGESYFSENAGRVLRCSEEGRLSILEGREMSVVTVNDVTADDSGKYVVCVENEGGGDSRFASVAVVGFPEPPGGEPTASEFTDHSLVLSWYGSMYDGGSVVTGYQVEMCTLPDKKWHKVTSSVNTSCSVQGLSMGQRYIFRVRAENKYGVSHPSKESKMICLNDFLQYDTSSDEEPEDVPENCVTIESGTHFTERFDLKEEVGKGKFGTVYRCVELSCGRPRAAKVIRCLKMKDKEKVRQEIEIMARLHHPKLMQVLAAFESGRNMIMVMEFISGGELFERVIADDFVLTEHDCILFMKQICDGVAYMHKNDILHLDLKPENILCKTRTSHKIKIIDFGLARVYKSNEDLRILFGTPEFVAPEVLNYEPVSPASDMWSVGVICYVLLSGLSPFMGDNDTETFANITRGEMDFDDEAFDEISQEAKDFISGLLVKKIKDRMSAEECLKHPWLATARLVQKRPLSTEKLKRFIIRRKWQKSGTAIRALGRMVSLSRSSLGSCDSYSSLGSPTSSRSRSSLVSRSETAESGDSEVFSR